MRADSPDTLLVNAILSPETLERDGLIILPPGVNWPDMVSNVLFVRHFYADLWEKVLQNGLGDPRAAVLCGSLGAGKSAFGLYVLYRALKEGRTVLLNSIRVDRTLFKGGIAYALQTDLANTPELYDDTCVYISDSRQPVRHGRAFTLQISSPAKPNWTSFVESPGVKWLTVPGFTLEEMRRLRSAAFDGKAGRSEGEMLALVDKWGPNPRYCLTHADNPLWQEDVLPGAGASIDELEHALQMCIEGVDAIGNRLEHINMVPLGALPGSTLSTADPNFYQFHHGELTSDHVLGMYARRWLNRDPEGLKRSLRREARDAGIASFRRQMYARAFGAPAPEVATTQ